MERYSKIFMGCFFDVFIRCHSQANNAELMSRNNDKELENNSERTMTFEIINNGWSMMAF